MTKLKDSIIEQIENMDDSELLALNNAFCEHAGYNDSEIYFNNESFFENFFAGDVMAAVRAVSYGEYNYNDEYVRFNDNANLETMSTISLDDLADSVEGVASYVEDNRHLFKDYFDFEEQDEDDLSELKPCAA